MDYVTGPVPGVAEFAVRVVEPSRPLRWLAAGWQDFRRAPQLSLFFGAAFVLAGLMILVVASPRPYLITSMISGYFLVAPFLALGLYQISRRLEAGEPPVLGDAVTAWRGNNHSFGLFAAFLGFAFIFWERLSAILFGLFHGRDIPPMETFTGWLFLVSDNPVFLLLYLTVGGALAALVFALSVVSVPMLLDRRIDVVTAAVISLRVVAANPLAMVLWAACIVALTLAGTMLLLLGLAVAMPVLGHATWHAYRDLVPAE
ncbi:DUF2189 domain-containing protein [Ectothiorhodospiraceae bacterium WFHF3C12]|nr:DUF2189 domain-containing protein [Ectothiorhodospiraceae bacterium WFHF3C12]